MRGPLLPLLLATAMATTCSADEQVVVLRDGRVLRGEVTRSGGAVKVVSRIRAVSVPEGHVLRTEPVPPEDAAPFALLAGRVATIDAAERTGPPVPAEARPVGASRYDPDGRCQRVLDDPRHLERGRFKLEYRITELHPTWFLLEGVERAHAVPQPTQHGLGPLLHALRLKGHDPARGDVALEAARFSRLAGWLELARSDLERAEADASAPREAIAAERAAIARAAARRALADAELAAARDEVEDAADALRRVDGDLDADSEARAAALLQLAADRAAVRACLEALAAAAGDDAALAAVARREAEALTADEARRLRADHGPLLGAPPAGAAALALRVGHLRAARRLGPWLDAETVRGLDLARLAQAEALVGRCLAARALDGGAVDEAALTRVLDGEVVPLVEFVPYRVWEALVRAGAGHPAWGLAPLEVLPDGAREVEHPDGPVSYVLHVPPAVRLSQARGRRAPLIVACHGQGEQPASMIGVWSEFAARQGAVLASVEYAVEQGGHRGVWREHRTVLLVIEELARRLAIDLDRVLLSGHSMGGHCVWDLACSHPDRFAGVVPVIGAHFGFEDLYRQNAAATALYVIDGEHDVDWPERNRAHTAKLQRRGADATYAEWVGRAHEGLYGELPWVEPWFAARRRQAAPRRLDLRACRPTDLRRFWVRIDRTSARLQDVPLVQRVPDAVAAELQARVEGRARDEVVLEVERIDALTLLLSDAVVDLDRPLTVKVGGRVRHQGKVERSVRTLLRDLVLRGDRAMPVAAELPLDLGRR